MGKVINEIKEESIGPSEEEQKCMKNCVLIEKKSEKICMQECNAVPQPKTQDKSEKCMQKCVAEGCEKYDFKCEKQNKEKCEEECGMKGDAPDENEMSKAQKCIFECVSKIDPSLECGSSEKGETGNEICQKCSEECVYLYKGPCLSDEEITEKEKNAQVNVSIVMGSL